MNTNLTLASVLRITADASDLPAGFTSKVLNAVADGLENGDESVQVIFTAGVGAQAEAAPVAAAPAQDASYVDLDEEDEAGEPNVVQAGDEWKLKDGLKHRDRRPVEWRVVTDDLIGREVGEFEKSIFRRPV